MKVKFVILALIFLSGIQSIAIVGSDLRINGAADALLSTTSPITAFFTQNYNEDDLFSNQDFIDNIRIELNSTDSNKMYLQFFADKYCNGNIDEALKILKEKMN